jgi:hypothetical protein
MTHLTYKVVYETNKNAYPLKTSGFCGSSLLMWSPFMGDRCIVDAKLAPVNL